jgi:alkylation response protein AidB-like acyl-CoA dehydrogenase
MRRRPPIEKGDIVELALNKAELAFRDQVREWLAVNVPREPRPRSGPASREFDLAWQARQYAGGWAGISWPKTYGGCGFSLVEQAIWYEEYARARAPRCATLFTGLAHAGPTIIARGSEAQKREHLPRILKGETIWCQGFSEPGAGSDLASLRTRAVIEGDELVVTGSKIWTGYAHLADWCELLVRTDASGPKHRGITWVIADMKAPGVVVRPIASMSDHHHFNEVFFNDVRIPLSNVVGEIGDGWSVALSTLGFERGTAFLADQIELIRLHGELVELARTRNGWNGRPVIEDEEIAAELGQLRADIAGLRALTYLNISRLQDNGVPGPEGSIVRLRYSELRKQLHRLSLDVLGTEALEMEGPDKLSSFDYLDSYHHTIAAGTSEIQRNIIGERVLGLPRG